MDEDKLKHVLSSQVRRNDLCEDDDAFLKCLQAPRNSCLNPTINPATEMGLSSSLATSSMTAKSHVDDVLRAFRDRYEFVTIGSHTEGIEVATISDFDTLVFDKLHPVIRKVEGSSAGTFKLFCDGAMLTSPASLHTMRETFICSDGVFEEKWNDKVLIPCILKNKIFGVVDVEFIPACVFDSKTYICLEQNSDEWKMYKHPAPFQSQMKLAVVGVKFIKYMLDWKVTSNDLKTVLMP
jgi:hypothetical protein